MLICAVIGRPTMGRDRDRFMIRPNIKLRVRVGSGLVIGS